MSVDTDGPVPETSQLTLETGPYTRTVATSEFAFPARLRVLGAPGERVLVRATLRSETGTQRLCASARAPEEGERLLRLVFPSSCEGTCVRACFETLPPGATERSPESDTCEPAALADCEVATDDGGLDSGMMDGGVDSGLPDAGPDGAAPDAGPRSDIGPPAPLAPANAATTGSVHHDDALRPTFRWSTVPGATAYQIVLESDGRDPIVARVTSPSFTPEDVLPVARTVPVGARYRWRVRACDDVGCGDLSDAFVVDVGRLAEDLNGDGYADVALGVPSLCDRAGSVRIYRGRPDLSSGFFAAAAWELSAPDAHDGDAFGLAIAAGDLDGDGFADLVVGAPSHDLDHDAEPDSNEGAAYVFHGSADGPGAASTLTAPAGSAGARFGQMVRVADSDGDGRREPLVGSGGASRVDAFPASGGSTPWILADGALLWMDVADLDVDGAADLLITESGPDTPTATVYYGPSWADATQISGLRFPTLTALAVERAGQPSRLVVGGSSHMTDVPLDVFVGGRPASAGGMRFEADLSIYIDTFGDLLTAADVDGDGDEEALLLAAGFPTSTAPGYDADDHFGLGRVVVYGAATGVVIGAATERGILEGVRGEGTGFGVAFGALDVDGDGAAETVVHCTNGPAGAGSGVQMHRWSDDGGGLMPVFLSHGVDPVAPFARAVANGRHPIETDPAGFNCF